MSKSKEALLHEGIDCIDIRNIIVICLSYDLVQHEYDEVNK